MNCGRISFNEIETISDISFNLGQIIKLPGNIVLSLVDANPKLAYFFELTCASGSGSVWSLSIIMWAIVYVLLYGINK
jgi:hypothetical protein